MSAGRISLKRMIHAGPGRSLRVFLDTPGVVLDTSGVVRWEIRADALPVADDPNRVVTVTASSGKTGAEVQISYTSCKVVGNGSFGVVFAAKMLGELGCYRRIVHWFKH